MEELMEGKLQGSAHKKGITMMGHMGIITIKFLGHQQLKIQLELKVKME